MKLVIGCCAASLVVMALAMGGSLVQAQQEPGAVERAGEKIDEAGREAGRKLDQAGRQIRRGVEKGLGNAREAVREQFSRTRDRVHEMNVESRIYGRLHWDKLLVTSTLELSVEARGIVTLRGSVPTAEAKERAVELAIDTVGVSRVIDQLAVQPPTASVTETTEVESRTPVPNTAPAPKPKD